MKKLNKDQKRLFLVLDRFNKYIKENPELITDISLDILNENLDQLFDDLQGNDFFGTEGQNDPRGDFRDGEWSMTEVDLGKNF